MNAKEKFFNLRPLLICALTFSIGIGACYLFKTDLRYYSAVLILFALALVSFIFTLLILFAKKKIYLLSILLSLIFLVVGYSVTAVNFDNYMDATIPAGNYTVEGRIDEITKTSNTNKVILTDIVLYKENGNDIALDYKLYAYILDGDKFETGDRISFVADVFNITVMAENTPKSYYLSEKLRYYASVGDERLVKKVRDDKTIFSRAENFFDRSLKSGLSGDSYEFARALLLGKSDGINSEVLDGFRFAGVAHIFAVSGLHIGFLASALYWILGLFKIRKGYRIIPTILILFAYSGMCGFTSSSIRASVMYSVMLILSAVGYRYDGLSALSLSAIILFFINPFVLLTAGFLLSFTVTGFIIILTPTLEKLFKKLPEKLRTALSVSFSAFLAGIPICIYYFGYLSFVSILLNIILIPIVSIIFTALFILSVIGGIFSISEYLLIPIDYAIRLIIYLMNKVNFRGLALFVGAGTGAVLFYYLGLAVFGGMFNLKGKLKTVVIILLLSVYCLTSIENFYYEKNSLKVSAYCDNKVSATVFNEKDASIVIISDCDNEIGYSVNQILNRVDKEDIDYLIVLDKTVDIRAVLDAFKTKTTVCGAYCFGDENKTHTYDKTGVYYSTGGKISKHERTNISWLPSGYGVKISFNDKTLSVYASLPDLNVNYYSGEKEYDFIIAQNAQTEFLTRCKKLYSYRAFSKVTSVEETRGITFRIA